jgi:hypothetical protein
VPRAGGIGGIVGAALTGEHVLGAGQYLLQVKSCRNVGKRNEKCKIEDEAFISAVGDQTTIATLIAIDTKIQKSPQTFFAKVTNLFGL